MNEIALGWRVFFLFADLIFVFVRKGVAHLFLDLHFHPNVKMKRIRRIRSKYSRWSRFTYTYPLMNNRNPISIILIVVFNLYMIACYLELLCFVVAIFNYSVFSVGMYLFGKTTWIFGFAYIVCQIIYFIQKRDYKKNKGK